MFADHRRLREERGNRLVEIDGTGSLLVAGARVFPIVLSNGPPPTGRAPSGRNGLAEVAAAGVSFVRTGRADWSLASVAAQVQQERTLLDAAAAHGLQGWLWLGDVPNLPATPGSQQEQLLARIVDGVQGHPALGAYKG